MARHEEHPTPFATGITDTGQAARLLDTKAGRSGAVLADWLAEQHTD